MADGFGDLFATNLGQDLCALCGSIVSYSRKESHRRWHEQNHLHGVDCQLIVQDNPHDTPTRCTCSLLSNTLDSTDAGR
jgi:hypothetical protein